MIHYFRVQQIVTKLNHHEKRRINKTNKIGIVIEEADETEFWLEFIVDENLKSKNMMENFRKEAYELTSIFITSRITAQQYL